MAPKTKPTNKKARTSKDIPEEVVAMDDENQEDSEEEVVFQSRNPTPLPKKKPRTLSQKAGLQLPVLKIYRQLRKGNYADRIQIGKSQKTTPNQNAFGFGADLIESFLF